MNIINTAQKSPQTTVDKLLERSSSLIYRQFDVEQLGGWGMLSNRLHEEYCSKNATIYLGMVCPACKGNDFSLGWGTYKNVIYCPDCGSQLGSFWSESRTKHRFSQQISPLGVTAFNGADLVGFIWGFEKTILTEDKPGLYIEMVVLDKKHRHSKLGGSAILGMFLSIEKILKDLNYPYIFVRTINREFMVTRWLKMLKYVQECECQEDSSRILYKKML
jgi:hypothetical protein